MNTERNAETWTAYQNPEDIGSNLWYIRVAEGLGGSMHGYCGKAKADLMSAAPDLLAAAQLQERHEWAKRNLESIGADPLNPDRLALVMEVERTGHDANVARKAAIAKAEGKA